MICGEVYHRIVTQLLEMVNACVCHGSVMEGPSDAANEVSVPWREDYKCVELAKVNTTWVGSLSVWLCAFTDDPQLCGHCQPFPWYLRTREYMSFISKSVRQTGCLQSWEEILAGMQPLQEQQVEGCFLLNFRVWNLEFVPQEGNANFSKGLPHGLHPMSETQVWIFLALLY